MAIRVPVMSPDIPALATPEVPTAPLIRPPEQAFGGETAAAAEGLGRQAQQTGQEIFDRILEHRQREDEQHVLDLHTAAQAAIQSSLLNPELDENNQPKGILLRQMNQAKGATQEFDKAHATPLMQHFMDQAVGYNEKMALQRMLQTSLIGAREQVVAHEARQTQAAYVNSFDAALKSTVASAANITDPKMLSLYVDRAFEPGGLLDKGFDHTGEDPKMKPAWKAGVTNEIIKSALIKLNEEDPDQAQKLFDGMKSRLTDQAANELQNQITGKKMDQTALQAWDYADKNFRRGPDHTIDRAALDSWIKEHHYPPNIEMHVMTMADRLSSVDASEIYKNKIENEKDYVNKLTTMVSTGKGQYTDALRLAFSYGGSASEIAEREKLATEAFTRNDVSFPMWLGKQGDDVRGAVESGRQQIEAAYPGKSESIIKQGALTELERQWLGKTAGQIRQITADGLKNVVTEKRPWFWPDKKETSWKVSAEQRPAYDAAKDRVINDGQPLTVENIKAAMAYLASQGNK